MFILTNDGDQFSRRILEKKDFKNGSLSKSCFLENNEIPNYFQSKWNEDI